MPVDMPPDYTYAIQEQAKDYIQTVEKEHGTDPALYRNDKMTVYYSSQLPHLADALVDCIHRDLDYIPDIDYEHALGFEQERIMENLPEVGDNMERGEWRGAYRELVAEENSNAVAKNILFEVDNHIIDDIPDFMERLGDIKKQEARSATERLKADGVMFTNDPVVESLAHLGNYGTFGVQPAIDVSTLDEELTSYGQDLGVVLYRLDGDDRSMLRASVGAYVDGRIVEDQNFAVCRAAELPVLAEYNKYVGSLAKDGGVIEEFCNAQKAMMNTERNAYEYEAPDALVYVRAMQEKSDSYAKYGHVSANPLHRVEDTMSAIKYAMENNRKHGLKEYAPQNINETMRLNGISQPLVDDLNRAPFFFKSFTKSSEKEMVSNLTKAVSPKDKTVDFNRYLQKSAAKSAR